MWDGVGVLRYGAKDWRGIGPFGAVTGIGGSKTLMIRTVTFILSGIPANETVYLDPLLRNRPAQAWTAGMDENGVKVNGEPYQEVDGLVDYQTLKSDDNGIQSIEMTIGERSIRSSARRASLIRLSGRTITWRRGASAISAVRALPDTTAWPSFPMQPAHGPRHDPRRDVRRSAGIGGIVAPLSS
ncbi:MAG: hypothetical protein WDN48_06090 [Pseudolabrys sp.]